MLWLAFLSLVARFSRKDESLRRADMHLASGCVAWTETHPFGLGFVPSLPVLTQPMAARKHLWITTNQTNDEQHRRAIRVICHVRGSTKDTTSGVCFKL